MWLIPEPANVPNAILAIKIARADISPAIALQYLTLRFRDINRTIDKWAAVQNQVLDGRYVTGNVYIVPVGQQALLNGQIELTMQDYEIELYTSGWYITEPQAGSLIYRVLGKCKTPQLFTAGE